MDAFREKEAAATSEEGKYSTSHLEHNVSQTFAPANSVETTADQKFISIQVGEVAMHGHVATDEHGHALVIIDEMEERRLRWKASRLAVGRTLSLTLPPSSDRPPCHSHHQSALHVLLHRSCEHWQRQACWPGGGSGDGWLRL